MYLLGGCGFEYVYTVVATVRKFGICSNIIQLMNGFVDNHLPNRNIAQSVYLPEYLSHAEAGRELC